MAHYQVYVSHLPTYLMGQSWEGVLPSGETITLLLQGTCPNYLGAGPCLCLYSLYRADVTAWAIQRFLHEWNLSLNPMVAEPVRPMVEPALMLLPAWPLHATGAHTPMLLTAS